MEWELGFLNANPGASLKAVLGRLAPEFSKLLTRRRLFKSPISAHGLKGWLVWGGLDGVDTGDVVSNASTNGLRKGWGMRRK